MVSRPNSAHFVHLTLIDGDASLPRRCVPARVRAQKYVQKLNLKHTGPKGVESRFFLVASIATEHEHKRTIFA